MQYLPLLSKHTNLHFTVNYRTLVREANFYSRVLFFLYKRWNVVWRAISMLFFRMDVLFVQRYFLNAVERAILRYRKVKIIYDVDDGIFLYNDKSRENFNNMISLSSTVIIGTPYLMKVCQSHESKVITLYGSVDRSIFYPAAPPKATDPFVIGWIGSASNLSNLGRIVPEIVSLLEIHENMQFHYVCNEDRFSQLHTRIKFIPWSSEGEADIIRTFSLGVMPLPNDEWSRYKGGYKLFLYLCCGIPVIASPVGINKSIVEDGYNGYLAETAEEWRQKILELFHNRSKYLSMCQYKSAVLDKVDLFRNVKIIEDIIYKEVEHEFK